MGFEGKSLKEKADWILANAIPDRECLCCHLHVDKDGYSQVGVIGKNVRAHRLIYEQLVGPTNELYVLHTCDNPRCVNHKHLYLGTAHDNMQDQIKRNRRYCGYKRGLSQEEALEAYKLYNEGATQQQLADKYWVNQSTICLTLKRIRSEMDV